MPHRLLLLLLLALAALPAAAVQRALLVGVSELPFQPQNLWLQAPRNDVLLMREVLQQQGFAPADIATLADGVPGAQPPDSRAIGQALQQLLARSGQGDFVLLYFSGHGTRLRDTAKRYQEPDGLAENFLARDVRGTIGGGRALSGGVRDVDVDGWIQAFLSRGVFVWAVFDTCSAASMTRSTRAIDASDPGPPDDEVRWRGVRPEQLTGGDGAAVPPLPAAPATAAVPRARYVAFFASESHQVTPELRLPRGDRQARPHGLLTWALAQGLQRRPATWRALFNDALAAYPPVIDELEQRFPQRELPSPVAEGSLDLPLFDNSARPRSTQPAWPAQRAGASLSLDAGQLDGLEAQQPVTVSAVLPDGSARSATARLQEATLSQSRLAVPAALQDAAGGALWSVAPVEPPPSLVLRVRTDRALPAGISLDYPAAVEPVDGEADLLWAPAGRAGQRLSALSADAARWSGAVPALAPLTSDAAVRRQLELMAQLKWFERLQQLAEGRRVDGLELAVETWEGERLVASRALPADSVAAPLPGQRLRLLVRNASGHSLDLAVLAMDLRGGLWSVYPGEAGEANRFERGQPQSPAMKRFDLPEGTAGRLLVVASPALPQSAPRLFGLSGAAPLADLRVRGQARPDRERQVLALAVRWGPAGAP